jgi:hypothetical protein
MGRSPNWDTVERLGDILRPTYALHQDRLSSPAATRVWDRHWRKYGPKIRWRIRACGGVVSFVIDWEEDKSKFALATAVESEPGITWWAPITREDYMQAVRAEWIPWPRGKPAEFIDRPQPPGPPPDPEAWEFFRKMYGIPDEGVTAAMLDRIAGRTWKIHVG